MPETVVRGPRGIQGEPVRGPYPTQNRRCASAYGPLDAPRTTPKPASIGEGRSMATDHNRDRNPPENGETPLDGYGCLASQFAPTTWRPSGLESGRGGGFRADHGRSLSNAPSR